MQNRESFRREAQAFLDRYYTEFPDADLERRAAKGLRFLATAEPSLEGAAAGWAAGLVYALGSWRTPGAGISGVLNDDLARIFGVSPDFIRKRAAAVRRELAVFPDTEV